MVANEIMKNFLSLILAVTFLAAATAHAAPTLIGGSPMVVNNTSSNCVVVQSFAANPNLQQVTVTHGALGSTNDIGLNVSNTLDQVSFTWGGIWHPQNTNPATEYIYAGSVAVTNYVRFSVVTTNSQSVIINYGQ